MEIDEILDYALSLPDTKEAMPFGPDTVVIKHHEKLFLILNLSKEPLSFNYKADPEDIITQREDHSEYIIPGYHMNKRHWNTFIINRQLPTTLVKSLIKTSHALVSKPSMKRLT
jgi:predicted DNA-binding protein (MmcQ/YjbR family)